MGLQIGTITLEINLEIRQKVGNNLPEEPAIPLLEIYAKDAPPYHYVHSDFVCVSQKLEETQMSYNKRMDTETWVIYTLECY